MLVLHSEENIKTKANSFTYLAHEHNDFMGASWVKG